MTGSDQAAAREQGVRRLRAQLGDIVAWRGMLPDAVASVLGLHSPGVRRSRGGARDGLPFRLDVVMDDLDEGAAGVRTDAGLGWLLEHWALAVHAAREPGGRRRAEGAGWVGLGVASPAAYLQASADWLAEHEPGEFEALCDDIALAHAWLAGVTGHAPVVIGRCWCGGDVLAFPGSGGVPEHGECDGACGAWYPDAVAVERAKTMALRGPGAPGSVTAADLIRIWSPDVPVDTMKAWLYKRGVLDLAVDPDVAGRWRLGAANVIIAARLGRRDERVPA